MMKESGRRFYFLAVALGALFLGSGVIAILANPSDPNGSAALLVKSGLIFMIVLIPFALMHVDRKKKRRR